MVRQLRERVQRRDCGQRPLPGPKSSFVSAENTNRHLGPRQRAPFVSHVASPAPPADRCRRWRGVTPVVCRRGALVILARSIPGQFRTFPAPRPSALSPVFSASGQRASHLRPPCKKDPGPKTGVPSRAFYAPSAYASRTWTRCLTPLVNSTVPAVRANRVSSLPMPTLSPGWMCVPR